jgi:beta-galactosidase
MRQYFTIPYMDQVHNAFAPIFNDNIDTAVIHVGHDDLRRYKMVVVAADLVMDKDSADALRRYVQGGGTVVMTAFSAKVNETGQVFDTPLPGRLSDVFGLRTSEFYNADAPLDVGFDGKTVTTSTTFYEVLEPSTAKVVARLTNVAGAPPAITENRFGQGRAIYVATAAQRPVMQALYRSLYGSLGIVPGPATPEGVYAREVDGRTLYVNTTTKPQDVKIDGAATGVLGGRTWNGTLRLEPFGAELLRR